MNFPMDPSNRLLSTCAIRLFCGSRGSPIRFLNTLSGGRNKRPFSCANAPLVPKSIPSRNSTPPKTKDPMILFLKIKIHPYSPVGIRFLIKLPELGIAVVINKRQPYGPASLRFQSSSKTQLPGFVQGVRRLCLVS